MAHNFNNFMRPSGGRRGRNWIGHNQKVPPGLRGKEIGLYFRDQSLKKKPRNLVINLTVPMYVLSSIESNLSGIKRIAKQCNISLPQTDNFKIYKNIQDIEIERSPAFKKKIKFEEKTPSKEDMTNSICMASTSADFIPISKDEPIGDESSIEVQSLRKTKKSDYKYGYEDIITGSFDEKLDECMLKGISINLVNAEIRNLNTALYVEYQDMIEKKEYKEIMKFREKLPAYVKYKEIHAAICDNQVIVISGETGCGKSTQVPQIILDEAICAKKGANVKILVTQPRRIATSSLAIRVSKERAEYLGNSVGYAVRLEKVEERSRGSIQFCTTGILLASLEINQSLSEYSHIILDEVHERDTNVDLSMCMLKKVLKKRSDLKLILMSATIDADRLSEYFDNCPLLHIEGIAYPVQDIYLEDILEMTKYKLPPEKPKSHQPKWMKHRNKGHFNEMEKDISYKAEISPWLESKKHELSHEVYKILQESRIEDMQLDLIMELLINICRGEPGAILVFLPGIGEITKLITMMEKRQCFPASRYDIYPLHSKLATLEQHKIFERPPEHKRKIVIATNIAETSITIDDIVYVVDSGKIKISGLNVERNLSTLSTEWVSQANLRQRRGRAGRCQPGICYHLLTSYRAGVIQEQLLPELQRSNLLEPVLMIKRLRLGLAAEALVLVPSPPSQKTIDWAVKHLQRCGALNESETLTPLGWHLARLPVHPAAGKLLLLGALFGLLDRAASVASVWGFKEPFQLVIGKEIEVDKAKRNLALGEPSDHVAISEAIIRWEGCSERGRQVFAYENFLSNNTLRLLTDMKKQLADNLRLMGFLPSGNVKSSYENRNSTNLSLFKAIVAASLYPNIAHVRWSCLNHRRKNPKFIARSPEDGRLSVHPSSVMCGPRLIRGGNIKLCDNPGANWLVYWLKQRSTELFVFDVTLIYTLPLLFFGEFIVTDDEDNPDNCMISILNIKVRCKRASAQKLFEVRCLLDKVLASKITNKINHSSQYNQFEENIINTVIQLITAEDEKAEYLGDDNPDTDNSESETDRY